MDKDILEKIYKIMVKIRFCEESLVEPIIKGEIKTPCHLYTGQEAIAVGICSALEKRDYVFSTHRSHGHFLAKGGNLKELIAEVYTKETGCSKGRGGSMHLISPENGFLGSVPIVGGTISLAMGSALASKIRKENRVVVSFFGDGAAGEGVLYESLNFSALKKLPLIFVCENNLYSTHLLVKECRPDKPIFEIAKPFGIETFQIDGNDVLKVFEVAQKAVELCRKGEPVFIECLTYRLRGHVGPNDNIQGDNIDIRPKEEVEEWKQKDPIKRLREYLLENNFKQEELEEIEEQTKEEIEQAHRFAKESSNPKDLNKYVFKQ